MTLTTSEIRPGFGAEVRGLDLSAGLAPAAAEAVRKALDRHTFLLFRNQSFARRADYAAFCGIFGDLHRSVLQHLDDTPEVLLVTNRHTVGPDAPLYDDVGARVWHTDGSHNLRSGMVTSLYAVEVPETGGGTELADTAAAYAALPEARRRQLDRLWAIHDIAWNFEQAAAEGRPRNRPLTEEQRRRSPPVPKPVVRVHPTSGRRSLYLSPAHTRSIAGMPAAEGRALIDDLVGWIVRPEFVHRHEWRAGDVLLWDNRAVLHRGTPYREGARRMLWRVATLDDELASVTEAPV